MERHTAYLVRTYVLPGRYVVYSKLWPLRIVCYGIPSPLLRHYDW